MNRHFKIMRIKTKLALLVFVVLANTIFAQQRGFKAVHIPIAGQQTKLYEQSHALIIGVSNYNNGWNVLNGVKADVSEVTTALEKNDFNVQVLMDADKNLIDKTISEFISKYGQNLDNRVLIYYAGHGYTVKTNYGDELGYIVPVNAPSPQKDLAGFQEKAIEMAQIEIYAKRIQSKHALFMFDACFAGSLFDMRSPVTEAISYKTTNHVRQFITSGSAEEQVPDVSIFRKQFVAALTTDEADYDKDGFVTGSELGQFLQTKVINYSYNSQHPQYGKIRNPKLDKGDFVFVLPNQNTIVQPNNPTINEGQNTNSTGNLSLITDYTGTAKITSIAGTTLQTKEVSAGSTYPFNALPSGIVVINIYSNSQLVWTSKVNIAANQTTTVRADKTTGALQLITEITGSLYIDGTFKKSLTACNTYTITDLSAGTHTLKIGADWQETIYITAGQTTTAKADKPAGTLALTTQVSGNFYIDDVLREYVNSGTVKTYTDIDPGTHDAKIVSSGQTLWQSSFSITAGQTEYLTAKATPPPQPSGGNYTETTAGLNMDMVFVKGGTFKMGDNFGDGDNDEKPVHDVTLSDFYMGKTEVTQKQWRMIMGSDPSELAFKGCDNCPVERVSWNDVQEFISKLNQKTGKTYRLPTEAEWEYAARGGNKSNGYKYAGSDNIDEVAWYTSNSGSKTKPVAGKKPNELGIYDMSGNVYEWCSDWYGDYSTSAQTNPKGASSGSSRVFRGGSWGNNAQDCRSARRSSNTPTRRGNNLGFRLVRVP